MHYKNIMEGIFINRPNRFIAICEIGGIKEVCHVKNTGRCKELLIPGTTVFLEKSENPERKTKYDLVAVLKNEKLFNIDSSAPNKVFYEWLEKGGLFDEVSLIKPEYKYKNSRFDFYVEYKNKKAFVEVKGVTLEENGVLLFPDAPTLRGEKHINELISALSEGFEAYVVFIIQTEEAKYFTPNKKTHPAFAEALKTAEEKGVKIICFNCYTKKDSLKIKDYIPLKLD